MQSCTKDSSPTPKDYKAPVPAVPTPGDQAVIPFTGTPISVDLKWAGTASFPITWSVYVGTDPTPTNNKAVTTTSNSYTTNITTGGTYYWQLVTVDVNNVKTVSPVWSFEVNSNPDSSVLTSPANNASNVSINPTLKWTGSDPENDNLTYDIYLDTASTPKLAYAGITASQLAVTNLLQSTVYNWRVVAKDPYGGVSTSRTNKFTTGLDPISVFVGHDTIDEPAESYTYGGNFTKKNATTITLDNYWNSGWVVDFQLDFTTLIYTFPVTTLATNWVATESGNIDPVTGTLTGTYTIWNKGKIAEQGTHTYTRVSKKKK